MAERRRPQSTPLRPTNPFEYFLYCIPLLFVAVPLLRSLDLPILSFLNQDASSSEAPITYEKTSALVAPDPRLQCPEHNYGVHIVQNHPLVVYLENFISPSEVSHLVNLSAPSYTPSTIHRGDEETLDPSVRDSSKARLPRDNVVRCIEARALAFQGWPADTYIERLWAQKYEKGGHYSHHFDWGRSPGKTGGGRVSTFMVYLQGEESGLKGGGTQFPRLVNSGGSPKWCELVQCQYQHPEAECLVEEDMGMVFRAIGGNAVYWENFDKDGEGYPETLHAGLPVEEGVKVGLNVWSWRQPGLKVIEEDEEEGMEQSGSKKDHFT